MILQDPQTSLNPVFTIGDQLREAIVRRTHGRNQRRDARGRRRAAPRRHRGAGAADRAVSAPDERRHEAARGRRDRDERPARGDDRRRADHRARCHHPAAVPEAAEAAAAGQRDGDPVHHPRFRRRGAHVRPCGGDVRRAHRRMRAGARGVRSPVASLHPGADRLGAEDHRHDRAPHHDRGPAAVADGPAGGLPLRAALPLCGPAVPGALSGHLRGRRGPYRRLLAARREHDGGATAAGRASAQALPLHQGRAAREDPRRGEGGGRRVIHDRRRRNPRAWSASPAAARRPPRG